LPWFVSHLQSHIFIQKKVCYEAFLLRVGHCYNEITQEKERLTLPGLFHLETMHAFIHDKQYYSSLKTQ
jgi:hypothetical protein